MRFSLMPAKRLARELMPTDSTNRPRAVLRNSSHDPTKTARTTKSETGSRSMKPFPRSEKASLKILILMEFVISCASPRPAIIRIRVATIGWMRT